MRVPKLSMMPPPYRFRTEKIRIGMVGGAGGFFGPVLYDAANLSGAVEVAACALHPDSNTAIRTGREWGIPHTCGSIEELAERARELSLDGVIIATMNSQHRHHCELMMEQGLHVFCEKPLTAEPADAAAVVTLARERNIIGGQNFTYLANPAWYKGAYIARQGGIGKIRKVIATYPQGWLIKPLGAWREKREFSGPFGSLQDIGIHCLSSVVFFTGEPIASVRCTAITHVGGREVEDDGMIEGLTEDGIPFIVQTTQVDASGINDHSVTVIGSEGTIRVSQVDAEEMTIDLPGMGRTALYCGEDYSSHPVLGGYFGQNPADDAVWRSLPGHHPPGLYGAIANNIRQWAIAVQRRRKGLPQPECFTFPDFELGGHLMMVLGAAEASLKEARVQFVDDI